MTAVGVGRAPGRACALVAASGGGTGLVQTPIVSTRATAATGGRGFLWPGGEWELDNVAGTRGFCAIAEPGVEVYGFNLAATAVHATFWPALVRVITPGAGSAFAANELALMVVVETGTATSVNSSLRAGEGWSGAAVDLFKVPATLL